MGGGGGEGFFVFPLSKIVETPFTVPYTREIYCLAQYFECYNLGF